MVSVLVSSHELHSVSDGSDAWLGHVLLGDLNALNQSDYTAQEWEAHCLLREQRAWEPPSSAVMSLLLTQASAASSAESKQMSPAVHVDSFRSFCGAVEFESRTGAASSDMDSVSLNAVQAARFWDPDRCTALKCTAHVGNPRFKIDYILLSHELAARCRVTNSMVDKSARGSDHFPVVSDLQFIRST